MPRRSEDDPYGFDTATQRELYSSTQSRNDYASYYPSFPSNLDGQQMQRVYRRSRQIWFPKLIKPGIVAAAASATAISTGDIFDSTELVNSGAYALGGSTAAVFLGVASKILDAATDRAGAFARKKLDTVFEQLSLAPEQTGSNIANE